MEDNCQLAILIFGTGLAISGALFGAIIQNQYTTYRIVDRFSIIHTENGYYKLNKSTVVLDEPKIPEYNKIEKEEIMSNYMRHKCGRSVISTKNTRK